MRFQLIVSSALTVVVAVLSLGAAPSPAADLTRPTPLTPYEAEILVAIVPDLQEARRAGLEPKWGYTDCGGSKDCLCFRAYASRTDSPSSLLRWLNVNLHTAQVWDGILMQEVKSEDLVAVQAILRKAHHVSEAIQTKYGANLCRN